MTSGHVLQYPRCYCGHRPAAPLGLLPTVLGVLCLPPHAVPAPLQGHLVRSACTACSSRLRWSSQWDAACGFAPWPARGRLLTGGPKVRLGPLTRKKVFRNSLARETDAKRTRNRSREKGEQPTPIHTPVETRASGGCLGVGLWWCTRGRFARPRLCPAPPAVRPKKQRRTKKTCDHNRSFFPFSLQKKKKVRRTQKTFAEWVTSITHYATSTRGLHARRGQSCKRSSSIYTVEPWKEAWMTSG